ncbi:MAG: PEP-CTERM sorting domain-containing protein [Spirulinaceae cyanobacterium]
MQLSRLSFLPHTAFFGSIVLSTAAVTAQPAQSATFTFKVAPNATFLHLTDFRDTAAIDAIPIALEDHGIKSGDFISLQAIGDFSPRFIVGEPDNLPENKVAMLGVFSSSSELLPRHERHRIPGAIDTGEDLYTKPIFSFYDELDIAEDFKFAQEPLRLQVPDFAEYLFVSTRDNYWGDNVDSDNDYELKIVTEDTSETESVPEPATVLSLLLLTGLGRFFIKRA